MSLLSRVAERIYWSARYFERAETTSRLARVYGNLLLDLPRQAGLKWDLLIRITGCAELYQHLHPSPGADTAERFFVADRNNPSSVRSSLAHARESVRTTRDIVPSEAWRSINELCMHVNQELDAETSHRRRYGIHSTVVEGCQQISGLLADTMSHDSGYQFFRIGRGMERADMTTRIIDVRSVDMLEQTDGLEPYSQLQWRSVLRSLHALQAYQLAVQEPIQQPLVQQFLFKNENLPRSLAYCTSRIRSSLRSLPRNQKPLTAINRVIRFLESVEVSTLKGAHLHAFIDDCQLRLAQLDREIDRTYFHARLRVAQEQTQSQS